MCQCERESSRVRLGPRVQCECGCAGVGGAGRPRSPLGLGPLLTSDLRGPRQPLSAGAKGLALLSPLRPLSVPGRGGCRPDAVPSVWEGGAAPTYWGCQPGCGVPATLRVLTASSLSSHRKTWCPTTRTCTNARRTSTIPISAAMEKATAVSVRRPGLAWAPRFPGFSGTLRIG